MMFVYQTLCFVAVIRLIGNSDYRCSAVIEKDVMEAVVVYPDSCQEGPRKTKKYLRQDSRYPGRNLNQAFPEYKSEALHLELRRL
jgi:hypothetical protein